MSRRPTPRYPELRVAVRSPNPMAVVAAVRQELRLAGAEPADIDHFTDQALSRLDRPHVLEVAGEWVGEVKAT